MSAGDITLFNGGTGTGAVRYNVAAGTTSSINPGEVCYRALYGIVVTAATNSTAKPVVATDYIAGIATTQSTETASAAGYVMVQELQPGQIWLMTPTNPTSWDTQSEYDALVGKNVLLSTAGSGGAQTILNTHGNTSGCTIQWLDVSKHPGKVAFSFRNGVSPLS
jgi:hypothetical protein